MFICKCVYVFKRITWCNTSLAHAFLFFFSATVFSGSGYTKHNKNTKFWVFLTLSSVRQAIQMSVTITPSPKLLATATSYSSNSNANIIVCEQNLNELFLKAVLLFLLYVGTFSWYRLSPKRDVDMNDDAQIVQKIQGEKTNYFAKNEERRKRENEKSLNARNMFPVRLICWVLQEKQKSNSSNNNNDIKMKTSLSEMKNKRN